MIRTYNPEKFTDHRFIYHRAKTFKSPFATSSGEPSVDPPKSANLAIVGL
jgi:hypothetical protein